MWQEIVYIYRFITAEKKETVGTTYAIAEKIIPTVMCDFTHLYWQNKLEKM